jgi:D-alanyl-D-alanine carboxypeptidase (penicillin-binding protein 5/6)
MNPASMTKVLTILVCAEQIEDLDKKVTMTMSANDYAFVTESSAAGLEVGERVSARDMLYCTILPSGADAAVSLAEYVAGSHEAFADLMNAKVKELGRDKTAHFTNAVGIYDEDLHCTVVDMAMIMKAALEVKVCREALTAHTYTTGATEEHPDGIFMSNVFLRRIEDYDDDFGVVESAKTGYVDEAGSCAVSYAITNSGKRYICVTGNSTGSWNCIYDHCRIYERYAK